jgi:transposase
MVKKSLSVRVHECPECGLVIDRDENAAINILRLGLESLGIALEAPPLGAGSSHSFQQFMLALQAYHVATPTGFGAYR